MRASAVLVAGLAFAAEASAQVSGTVCGTVTDQTGGVIPGVEVSLSQPNTVSKTAFTAKDGEYIFTGVEPGTYGVTFVFDYGFKKAVRHGIAIGAGQQFRADQRMEPAGPSSHPDPASASVDYDKIKTAPGATFTRSIAEARASVKPCKVPGL